MNVEGGQPLLPVECEAFCQSLQKYDLRDVGSSSWSRQHEKLEKLNMQAIANAAAEESEFVKEFLINEGKYPMLIEDLLTTELWREKIFSQFIAVKFEPKITFPVYMVLYHEATLVNLLETTLYYQETCESCGDAILDLIDYCHRKLIWLSARSEEDLQTEVDAEDAEEKASALGPNMKELSSQDASIQFDIAIKCLSLLRYICDHLSVLPLSCSSRILNSLDFPVLLVEILQNSPWTKADNGKLQKYIDNKWTVITDSDRFKLTKTEGQIWLTLYKLLMDPDCMRKYELNGLRKNTLLKLRSHLNELMVDQLPILGDLHMYLERLSMMEAPASKQDLILEQMPEIRARLLEDNNGKFVTISKNQMKKFFDPSEETLKEQAKRWADTYNFDMLESLISEPAKCAVCGELATKRCSRCQNEWYCRRECQVTAWKKHKSICDMLYTAKQPLK
ncbi:zinc finger MYND domain-containing protein 10-like [Watersipora subatra]|uniref:zinc finger MYND domain-containing protein 10-like n=1 Tax=Watersipora subatra TaxID=2589382 RepID=UPI00355B955B